MKQISYYIFLIAKDYYYYRTMTPGWQGAAYSRRYGRELRGKTGDSVEEKLEGLP